MAKQGAASMLLAALVLGAFSAILLPTVQSIGVCYGTVANNLPTASDVVQLYKSSNISSMRIFSPDGYALQALGGTNISLIVDVANENIAALASDPAAATAWVQNNVKAYPGVSFLYIAVGNEVAGNDTQSILPAMQNLNTALSAAGLGSIKVSTTVRFDVIANSFPPSNGVFEQPYMTAIARFLASTGAPLLANVYPYFAYRDNSADIKLNYATFQPGTTVGDGGNGLSYTNLFDAMTDAIVAALEKAGAPNVTIVVSESGWPSAGGFGATVDSARSYSQGLINHVSVGTPKRPGPLQTYIFALFNENQKPGEETEKHFGLFNPDKSPSYPITF